MNEGRAEYAPTPEEEPLPPYSTTWGNDVVKDDEEKRRKAPIAWILTFDSIKHRTEPIVRGTTPFLRENVLRGLKKAKPTKKQLSAFSLVIFLGLGPFITVGLFTGSPEGQIFGTAF